MVTAVPFSVELLGGSPTPTTRQASSPGDRHLNFYDAWDNLLVDGQHRLAAVIEADVPVEMTVFTEVEPDTFDVLDTSKKRNAADVLAIEGEKSTTLLAAMVRTVWQYQNRPDQSWTGGAAEVTNHQIVQTLEANPGLRDYVSVADRCRGRDGDDQVRAGAVLTVVDLADDAVIGVADDSDVRKPRPLGVAGGARLVASVTGVRGPGDDSRRRHDQLRCWRGTVVHRSTNACAVKWRCCK